MQITPVQFTSVPTLRVKTALVWYRCRVRLASKAIKDLNRTSREDKADEARNAYYAQFLPEEQRQFDVAMRWFNLKTQHNNAPIGSSKKELTRQLDDASVEVFNNFLPYLERAVITTCNKFHLPCNQFYHDLMTTAKEVFFKVLNKWDPTKNSAPSRYLSRWITAEVRASALSMTSGNSAVRIDRRFRNDAWALRQAMNSDNPNAESELIQHRKWGVEKVSRLKQYIDRKETSDLSLDDHEGKKIASSNTPQFCTYETSETLDTRDVVTNLKQTMLRTLSAKELYILSARFGFELPLNSFETNSGLKFDAHQERQNVFWAVETTDALSRKLAVGREAIRRDFDAALQKLHGELQKNPRDFDAFKTAIRSGLAEVAM